MISARSPETSTITPRRSLTSTEAQAFSTTGKTSRIVYKFQWLEFEFTWYPKAEVYLAESSKEVNYDTGPNRDTIEAESIGEVIFENDHDILLGSPKNYFDFIQNLDSNRKNNADIIIIIDFDNYNEWAIGTM